MPSATLTRPANTRATASGRPQGHTVQPVHPDRLQSAALAQLTTELYEGGRGLVVMPCGCGKTLVGRWLAESLSARLTVVFVPSIELLAQTVLEWRSQTSWPHTAMIVCSDPTSGRAVAVNDLDLPEWTREQVRASTDVRVINRFLQDTPGPAVVFSTYHSAPRVAEALRRAGRQADLAICDEAHRLGGQPSDDFRSVLDDDALPARRRAFLTATPVEATGQLLALDDECPWAESRPPSPCLSLRDETVFGRELYRARIADGISVGRLVDYDVHVLARYNSDEPGNRVSSNVAALLAAGADGAGRVLSFHSRVRHARAFAEAVHGLRLPDGRRVHADYIEHAHTFAERAAKLDMLRRPPANTLVVVASARTLSEGVNVPAVDTVLVGDPKTSAREIVQIAGRVMRAAPGKTRGRIVLPVSLGNERAAGLDTDTVLATSVWRPAWTVLRALATVDPRFEAHLREPRKSSTTRRGPRLVTDLPVRIDLARWRLQMLDRTGVGWWAYYDALREWAGAHGHAHPDVSVRHNGLAIGRWAEQQGSSAVRNTLSGEQTVALETLPGWAWSPLEAAWWVAWGEWHAAAARTNITSGARNNDDAAWWQVLAETAGHPGQRRARQAFSTLASFAAATCLLRRRGELTDRMRAAAEQLPRWQWDALADHDVVMLDALAEYAAWKDDFNPPHEYVHDSVVSDGAEHMNLPVGKWITALRRRKLVGRLHSVLAGALEFVQHQHPTAKRLAWKVRDTRWRLGLLALHQYAARTGGCRMPQGHRETLPDGYDLDLSRWCTVQRLDHRRDRLDPARGAQLEAMPGWQWEVELREGYRPTLPDVEHGKRASYAKGCRCDPCTNANAAHEAHREELRSAGVATTDLVDAGKARGHLRILIGRGATQKGLARAANVNVKTIAEVTNAIVVRIRPETEQMLLALTLESERAAAAPGARVNGKDTWAILDRLIAQGWPRSWIARELGHGNALQLRRDSVTAGNAAKVTELAQRIGTRTPPPRQYRKPMPALADILAAEHVAERFADSIGHSQAA